MTRLMIVLSLLAFGAGQGIVMASFCPSTPPDGMIEVFCEDFDTYCAPNEFPGGDGAAKGMQCPDDSTCVGNNVNLHMVWPATSTGVPCQFDSPQGASGPCMPRPDLDSPVMRLDNSILPNGSEYYYASSRPFACRVPSGMFDEAFGKEIGEPIPQHTFKDPVTGELNISRFIANTYGKFRSAIGLDSHPLVLSFMLDSKEDGAFLYSNGYIELSYGDPANPLNRANTDYAMPPDCRETCNGLPGRSVKYPVICDLWNPNMGWRLPACPNPTITLPPRHNAIALGLLPMTDPGPVIGDSSKGPCHCLDMAHGGQSSHPFMFNGQVWYEFRNDMPVPGCVRTVKDMNGVEAYLPEELKSFVVFGNPLSGGTGTNTVAIGKSQNWFTLTIMTRTAKLKHFQYFTSKVNGVTYQVTDELADIPLAYSGPFNSIRIGVGPGCRLAANGSWDCDQGPPRNAIASMVKQGQFVEFDDIALYSGWVEGGACCLTAGGGTCLDNLRWDSCTQLGGTYMGVGTECSDPSTHCCPAPYADFDGDKDVDSDDFARLQLCYTGTEMVTGQCACFDRNGDNKVNLIDVSAFANCATGPGIKLDGECP